MSLSTSTVALSRRSFSEEDMNKLRAICDEHKFSYGVFCSIAMSDVLSSEELTERYIRKTQQFEDDQRPATMADMKTLREQVRQQEEELQALREFKELARNSINEQKAVNAYR